MVGSMTTQIEEKERIIQAEIEASEHINQKLLEA